MRRALASSLLASLSFAGGGCGGGEQARATEPLRPELRRWLGESRPVDLLIAVDDSPPLADKRQALEAAAPDLVRRLQSPPCVRDAEAAGLATPAIAQPEGPDQACPPGSRRAFRPVRDLHVAVVSSSQGGHGEGGCEARAGALGAAGLSPAEPGCAFPSTLEAWYRFLVEPSPPLRVLPPASSGQPAAVEGLDASLLEQRADFLRPDSLLVVMVVADRNDCSIIDGALPADVCDEPIIDPQTGLASGCRGERQGWPVGYVEGNFAHLAPTGPGRVSGEPSAQNHLVARLTQGGAPFHLARASSACESDPRSPGCASCAVEPAAPGCEKGPLSDDEDPPSLRCWDARRRFGWDPLYPLQRYVAGLRNQKIYDRLGALVDNPVFSDLPFDRASRQGRPLDRPRLGPRPPSLVRFLAVVGVPWQDLSGPEIDWPLVLGDPFSRDPVPSKKGLPPADPLMRESPWPRQGAQPVTGEAIDASMWNHVNGHERDTGGRALEHACVFRLPEPVDCSGEGPCDCAAGGQAEGSPLCEGEGPGGAGDGVSTTTQRLGEAYPGSRFLQVARELGPAGGVASYCSPELGDRGSERFGYRALEGPLGEALGRPPGLLCLPRALPLAGSGATSCSLLEGRFAQDGSYAEGAELASCRRCDRPGREGLDAPAHPDLAPRLPSSVSSRCLCAVRQLEGEASEACQRGADGPAGEAGFCYIDPSLVPEGSTHDQQSAALSVCGPGGRALRVVGLDEAAGELVLLCPP